MAPFMISTNPVGNLIRKSRQLMPSDGHPMIWYLTEKSGLRGGEGQGGAGVGWGSPLRDEVG